MIYFIKNIVSGTIKIGFSDTPNKRLKDLQTGSPDRLVLIKTIPGDRETESNIHQQFSHCRLEGEWFASTDELLEFIKGQNKKALVDKFFHTFKDGRVEWQGYIVSEPHPGFFLIQLFEWVTGEASCQKLVRIDKMMDWDFYDTDIEMNDTYERNWKNKT